MKTIQVTINHEQTTIIAPGKTIRDVLFDALGYGNFMEYITIKNNVFSSLQERVDVDSTIGTFPHFWESSRRAYETASVAMLQYVVENILPGQKLSILHSMCDGIYCKINQDDHVSEQTISMLKNGFTDLVSADTPIVPELYSRGEAQNYFQNNNRPDTAALLKYCSLNYVMLYSINGSRYWLPSPPAPSTGLIKTYDIIKYKRGFVFRNPIENMPGSLQPFYNQERLYEIFNETEKWGNILDITNTSQLNSLVATENISEMIKISEALHERKIAEIADRIESSCQTKRLVFIAGPSSSGKTTFMKRLYIQLRVLGHRVVSLSLDNYFKDRDELAREQGDNLNFEVLDALDLKLLNTHLTDLLAGKPVTPPDYDFINGKKVPGKTEIHADQNTLFIIEGIHGINPGLTENIDGQYKFKIYLSALTHLNFDDTNRIPTHDTRLIRRIVRDAKYRGYSAAQTINMWKKVVEGEKRYIFKYQGEADIMFNSSLAYEIGALKQPAEIALKKVEPQDLSHPESERLLSILAYFLPVDQKEIPPTSILREFVGESSFKYH